MAQQIESKDIKLYASEKLNDANDGGGRVTANEIESGKINNVFQDISRVDHANGSVELRKLFMGIRTQNNAPLLGAHMLVVEPPQDENVTTLIFQTAKEGRETDVRTAARDYLENYYIKASREFIQPLGLNVQMSTNLTMFAALTVPVRIKAGDTIVLHNSENGLEEYVKIQSISVTRQTFVYEGAAVGGGSGGYHSFDAQAVRCQLVSPLMNSWDGGEARPSGVTNTKLTVFSTIITDAARYRGATKLTQTLEAGDTSARVENVLQPLVPVARLEQALVGKSPYTDISPIIRGTDADETPLEIKVTPTEATGVVYMPTAVTRGSMTAITGTTNWNETGSGTLVQSGTPIEAALSVDYASGIINHAGLKDTEITFRYLPAAGAEVPAVTTGLEITQANLGLVYTFDLSDLPPEPATIYIEYMAASDWLVMADNGQGAITGQGIGTVDYSTGQIQVTLEREPELGSYILVSYLPERALLFGRQSGVNQAEDVVYERVVNFGKLIKPGTLTITDESETLTSTDDGKGAFTGTAGIGRVEYATGKIILTPESSAFETTYKVTADTSDTGRINAKYPVTVTSNVNVSLAIGQSIMPGTLTIKLNVRNRVAKTAYEGLYKRKTETISESYTQYYSDDGEGNIKHAGAIVGTINYSTGAVSMIGVLKLKTYQNIETNSYGNPSKAQYTEYQTVDSNNADVICMYDTANYAPLTKEVTIEAAQIRITDVGKYEPIIPKTIWLKINGVDYFDDGKGKLITNYSAATSAGTQVGNINYQTGELSIQNVSVTSSDVEVKSVVTLIQGMTSDQLIFAIKDRPLRHSSFQMNIETVDGTTRRYIADENGNIKTTPGNVSVGTINIKTGVVIINASALPGTPESRVSVLGSLRYNAVKSESLPVDPDIVGLNVQRLPIDGRVPIFKLGDTVVFNHSETKPIDTPVAGATETLSRQNIAEATVFCDDKQLSKEQYEIDLKLGTVTFANPLTLETDDGTPLSGDWSIEHRIEHMTLATRVQQSGILTLQVPSAHDFPANTIVSSALLFGDLQADVLNLFTQKTWQNNAPNWTDQPDSSGETTARYDTINYPIAVSNESAVTDKWAIVFKSSSTVDVVSENLGVIITGISIGSQIAPINPVTEKPYFVIQANGWGGGWATGNVLRFNTKSALAPFWIARTVTPAQGITESDGFTLSPRGDSQ